MVDKNARNLSELFFFLVQLQFSYSYVIGKHKQRVSVVNRNVDKVTNHPSLRKGGCHEPHDIEDLYKIGQSVRGLPSTLVLSNVLSLTSTYSDINCFAVIFPLSISQVVLIMQHINWQRRQTWFFALIITLSIQLFGVQWIQIFKELFQFLMRLSMFT